MKKEFSVEEKLEAISYVFQGESARSGWITGSVLMIIFQDRQSINVNETSNELS